MLDTWIGNRFVTHIILAIPTQRFHGHLPVSAESGESAFTIVQLRSSTGKEIGYLGNGPCLAWQDFMLHFRACHQRAGINERVARHAAFHLKLNNGVEK